MTAAKPLARYSATQERARERLPNRPSYTIQWDTTHWQAKPAGRGRRCGIHLGICLTTGCRQFIGEVRHYATMACWLAGSAGSDPEASGAT